MNDGGPAFPIYQQPQPEMSFQIAQPGMSVRDYFAGQALPALITTTSVADANANKYGPEQMRLMIARGAYLMADAMIKAGTEARE